MGYFWDEFIYIWAKFYLLCMKFFSKYIGKCSFQFGRWFMRSITGLFLVTSNHPTNFTTGTAIVLDMFISWLSFLLIGGWFFVGPTTTNRIVTSLSLSSCRLAEKVSNIVRELFIFELLTGLKVFVSIRWIWIKHVGMTGYQSYYRLNNWVELKDEALILDDVIFPPK